MAAGNHPVAPAPLTEDEDGEERRIGGPGEGAGPGGSGDGLPNSVASIDLPPARGRSPCTATISPRQSASSSSMPCIGSSLWKCIVYWACVNPARTFWRNACAWIGLGLADEGERGDPAAAPEAWSRPRSSPVRRDQHEALTRPGDLVPGLDRLHSTRNERSVVSRSSRSFRHHPNDHIVWKMRRWRSHQPQGPRTTSRFDAMARADLPKADEEEQNEDRAHDAEERRRECRPDDPYMEAVPENTGDVEGAEDPPGPSALRCVGRSRLGWRGHGSGAGPGHGRILQRHPLDIDQQIRPTEVGLPVDGRCRRIESPRESVPNRGEARPGCRRGRGSRRCRSAAGRARPTPTRKRVSPQSAGHTPRKPAAARF